jgi:hypothetical protein
MKFGVRAEAADFGAPPARAPDDQLTGLASLRTTDENPTSTLSRTGVADERWSHRHGSPKPCRAEAPREPVRRERSLTTDTARRPRRQSS